MHLHIGVGVRACVLELVLHTSLTMLSDSSVCEEKWIILRGCMHRCGSQRGIIDYISGLSLGRRYHKINLHV